MRFLRTFNDIGQGKAPTCRRNWLKSERKWKAEARKLRSQKLRISDIAQRVGRSYSAVQVAVKKVGVNPDRPRPKPPEWHTVACAMRRSGSTLSVIGQKFGVTTGRVWQITCDVPVVGIADRDPQDWIKLKNRVIALRLDGCSVKAIAGIVNKPERTVSLMCDGVGKGRPIWHREARILHAQGMSMRAIAARISKSPMAISYATRKNVEGAE